MDFPWERIARQMNILLSGLSSLMFGCGDTALSWSEVDPGPHLVLDLWCKCESVRVLGLL